MSKFNGNFIGHDTNVSLKFSGSDNEDRFKENLRTQPDDWYYRFNEITYDYNAYGHRCKNIEDIDLDNYILFSGCSHTQGVGLELEKTFPYLVADSLGIDYYNLALGGSGIDVMTYNLIAWFNNIKKLPKAVIIVWTYEPRFSLVDDNDNLTFWLPSCPNGDVKKFMALGSNIGYFKTKKELSMRMVRSCYSETTLVELEPNAFIHYDMARDLGHHGIISQQLIAKKITRLLNK